MNAILRADMTVDSRTIASGCGIKHPSAIRLLNGQLPAIEAELGTVRFEIAPSWFYRPLHTESPVPTASLASESDGLHS